jgi:hypothetical protein
MSPWLIVTTGWPVLIVTAGHAFTASAARLILAAGTAVAAVIVGLLAQWRHRNRKGADSPTAPPSTS